jgi:hypothetical protein
MRSMAKKVLPVLVGPRMALREEAAVIGGVYVREPGGNA